MVGRKRGLYLIVLTVFLITALNANAQIDTSAQKSGNTTTNKWYDNFSLRGYVQVRYNRLLETNENLGCDQCDKSWGKDGGFFIRRTRIIFFGQISERVYFYVQPDFVSAPS